MNIQKSDTFVKKNLKINKKIKNIIKNFKKVKKYHKARDHCHYTGQYRDVVHNICNF